MGTSDSKEGKIILWEKHKIFISIKETCFCWVFLSINSFAYSSIQVLDIGSCNTHIYIYIVTVIFIYVIIYICIY